MIPHSDKSIRAGWVKEYVDGSGWTGADQVNAQLEGWRLNIGTFGIAVENGSGRYTLDYAQNAYLIPSSGGNSWMMPIAPSRPDKPIQNPEEFSRLLERAMCGEELSIKALYLIAYNDPRHSEFIPTVNALIKSV